MTIPVNAFTIMLSDAVPDLTATVPKFKNIAATLDHTPVTGDVHVDFTNKNTGRTESASESHGRKNQRANH